GAFVYSCDEVISQLANSDFEQYSKNAYVIVEEGFSNWPQLEQIFLHVNETSLSFAEIAKSGTYTENLYGEPWKIT
ncbi:hypothetical protein PMAYCL1PPCAC_03997, partial [Pristionchus mayeri]